MLARSWAEEDRGDPAGFRAAGRFGPRAYADWRGTSLGTITERLERRLILELAGDVRGRAVLDVGCGDGALAMAFRRRGAAPVVGCDPDPRMIARAAAEAERQHAEIGYVLAAAEQLPFGEQVFDVVSIITVLAFVPQADLVFREIARVLRPGGRLVLGDLGKWSPWAASRRIRARLGRAPIWKAARFRSAAEIRVLTEAAGLSVEVVRGAVFYPRWPPAALLMAPYDPMLGHLTTFGAAFIALTAVKRAAVWSHEGAGAAAPPKPWGHCAAGRSGAIPAAQLVRWARARAV